MMFNPIQRMSAQKNKAGNRRADPLALDDARTMLVQKWVRTRKRKPRKQFAAVLH